MDNIYIKSIQAVQKVMINDKHCFELYPDIVTPANVIILVECRCLVTRAGLFKARLR